MATEVAEASPPACSAATKTAACEVASEEREVPAAVASEADVAVTLRATCTEAVSRSRRRFDKVEMLVMARLDVGLFSTPAVTAMKAVCCAEANVVAVYPPSVTLAATVDQPEDGGGGDAETQPELQAATVAQDGRGHVTVLGRLHTEELSKEREHNDAGTTPVKVVLTRERLLAKYSCVKPGSEPMDCGMAPESAVLPPRSSHVSAGRLANKSGTKPVMPLLL